MAEMTIDQQRALALAQAKRRRADAEGGAKIPPEDGGSFLETATDVVRSGLTGVRSGVEGLAGIVGDANQMQGKAAGWIAGKFGASPETQENISAVARRISLSPFASTSEDIRGLTDPVIGEGYEPKTTAGKFARTAAEFVPGAVAMGGGGPVRNVVGNALKFGALPGASSEAAGQLTDGVSIMGHDVEPFARIVAALAAPAGFSMFQKAVSPFGGISPERLRAAETLKAEGVNPTAGQLTGNRNLKAMESELGGGATSRMMDDQAASFTDAAMRRAGERGLATSENMTALKDRLETGFKDIAGRNTLLADRQIGTDIGNVLREYDRVLPTAQREVVNNMADDILEHFSKTGGRMDGVTYQANRSRFSRMANSAKVNDPEFGNAMRGLRNALDTAMSRSVMPEDAAQWERLHREYGNMKVLEKAATGAGENAALGTISPSKLRQALVSGRRGQYARGEGELDELARSGESLLKPLPDSGTPTRLNARVLGGMTGAGGAGAGAFAGGPAGAVIGALLGGVAPFAAGRALMSRPVQAYLSNQLAGSTKMSDPRFAAVVQALLANDGDGR